jgi:hypothetical protein
LRSKTANGYFPTVLSYFSLFFDEIFLRVNGERSLKNDETSFENQKIDAGGMMQKDRRCDYPAACC